MSRHRQRCNDGHRLEALASDAARAPDLTRAIMGRLGYMRVPVAVARRARRRRWAARTSLLALALLLSGLAITLHNAATAKRGQQAMPVPAALSNDLVEYQQRLGHIIEYLRVPEPHILPADPEPGPGGAGIPPDVDRSAIAPVRWT